MTCSGSGLGGQRRRTTMSTRLLISCDPGLRRVDERLARGRTPTAVIRLVGHVPALVEVAQHRRRRGRPRAPSRSGSTSASPSPGWCGRRCDSGSGSVGEHRREHVDAPRGRAGDSSARRRSKTTCRETRLTTRPRSSMRRADVVLRGRACQRRLEILCGAPSSRSTSASRGGVAAGRRRAARSARRPGRPRSCSWPARPAGSVGRRPSVRRSRCRGSSRIVCEPLEDRRGLAEAGGEARP